MNLKTGDTVPDFTAQPIEGKHAFMNGKQIAGAFSYWLCNFLYAKLSITAQRKEEFNDQ